MAKEKNILILSFGNVLDAWIKTGVDAYLRINFPLFSIEHRRKKKFIPEEIPPKAILLDPEGELLSTKSFTQCIEKSLFEGERKIIFVVGPHEGFPLAWKQDRKKISLSLMTLPHQLALLLLAEQIYRAAHIHYHIPYDK